MNLKSHALRSPARLIKLARPLCLGLITALCGLLLGQTATAQITTETLIGDSVSEIGARYSDVDEAIKRFTNRDILGARQFLEAAKSKNPQLPPTDITLAKMYFLAGNMPAGRASLEKAAMEHPGDPEPILILADQATNQSRTIEAEALYDKALPMAAAFDENPKRKRNFEIRARTGRALVYERRKNWNAAVADLQALLKVDPDNAMAHYRLGTCLFMQNKARDGYNSFVKARELQKDLPNPYVAAALMYDRLGQASEAQQAFDRAVAASKDDINTLNSYAQWLIKTGSVDKAESVLASARQVNPESLDALILSGVAARMNKKMKPAEDYFLEAFRIAPSNGGVINQLALLLIDQPATEKRERALQFAGINAKLNPESSEANISLAWVLYQLGRASDANQALRNGIQLGNLTPDSSYLVAKMLSEQNQADSAKQLLDGALQADSTAGIFINRAEAQSLRQSLR